jgi:hypothetical protein
MRFRVDAPGADEKRIEPISRGRFIAATGRVIEIGPRHLELEGGVSLRFTLPPAVLLAPLAGTTVKIAVHDEPCPGGPMAQTLVIADAQALPRIIARFGPAGSAHTVGRWRVRTAISRRPHGPMAFGTEKLQFVIHAGDTVAVHDGAEEFVVSFVARTPLDYVSYIIAQRSLWRVAFPATPRPT